MDGCIAMAKVIPITTVNQLGIFQLQGSFLDMENWLVAFCGLKDKGGSPIFGGGSCVDRFNNDIALVGWGIYYQGFVQLIGSW